MKKFLMRLSVFVLYALLLQVVFPVAVDPFHVFHPESMRELRVTPNTNYIKMVYILNHPERFDSFIFGSSRVGAIHPEKMPGKTYNMTYGKGIPAEYAANIKTFLQSGMRPARIYVGVDSLSYTGSLEDQIMEPSRCPYEYLRDNPGYFYSLYLNPMDTLRSLWTMYTKPEKSVSTEVFFRYGYGIDYDRKTDYVWRDDDDISPTEYQRLTGYQMNLESSLASIREMVEMCRESGTELILFTNPMYRLTYRASLKKRYFEFLEGLAEITPFWNFSSLNDVTTDRANYLETSHYRAEVGDILINVMCYGKSYPELNKQGFGVKITRENAKDFITMLRKQAEDYTE